jgi:LPXTG-motif cell wall-anchored protein
MKEYKYVLFDLDGTLTDPAVGITTSVAYALKKFGIEVEDISTLNHFIGPPLLDTFMEDYGFSKEKAQTAIDYYRERFRVKGLYENVVYDGVFNMLEKLKNGGREIILATSKPEPFAREILRYFGMEKYFLFIAGSNFDPMEGVSAFDYEDGDITDKIIILGSVNTNKPGKYNIIYRVSDKDNNISEFVRQVLVYDNKFNIVDNPKTGEENAIIWLATGALALMGIIFLNRRKK